MHFTQPYLKRAALAGAVATLILGLCAPHAANAQTYSIDDGTAENSVGLTNGGTAIFFNGFSVVPGQNTIGSILVAFGTPTSPNPAP
jgi:hypothetical protein